MNPEPQSVFGQRVVESNTPICWGLCDRTDHCPNDYIKGREDLADG